MKDDHKYIWLEPEPPMDDDEIGRTWCQDDVYDPYDYDGNEPTLYIKNDIHQKRIVALEAQVTALQNKPCCKCPHLKAQLDTVRSFALEMQAEVLTRCDKWDNPIVEDLQNCVDKLQSILKKES